MRIGTVALVVALALAAAFPAPAPAQVPSGPLSIHVEAVLREPITVGVRTVFPVNGTAVLTQLIVEESDANGQLVLYPVQNVGPESPIFTLGHLELRLFEADEPGGSAFHQCTGRVDDAGIGCGRCASSGEFEGPGHMGRED